MIKQRLKILHLEDDPLDAELVQVALANEGIPCDVQVVVTGDDFISTLDKGGIDLVLADFSLPDFDGMTALAITRKSQPDLPFIFVSGRMGEEAAIESLRNGATDYVLKSKLSRLPPATMRALSEAEERAERRKAEEALARAAIEIRERAESYQNLFNSMRDVIVVTDHDRTILHANQPALREIFGYELEEIISKNVSMLYATEDDYRLMGREIFDRRESAKGMILELNFRRKNGEISRGELYALKRLDSTGKAIGNIGIIRDISERKKAEEALRDSEMRSYQLQVELACAAEVQTKLLPGSYPQLPGFDIAARCLPAKQVGGDFFDWHEVSPGILNLTFGDVMGKGISAAMLMVMVKSTIRSVAQSFRPAEAIRLAETALFHDLDRSESFVTLFHAQLNTADHSLAFVDCGHGFAFLLRANGSVENLVPRGLPIGVPTKKSYEEGLVFLAKGDSLIIYSDGLIDARPDLELNNKSLAENLLGAANAEAMVARLFALSDVDPLPDDQTVLVVRCTGQ